MIKNQNWRIFLNDESDCAMSVAMSDALFQLHSQGKSKPSFMINRVKEPTLTIGNNQRVNNDVNNDLLKKNSIKLVRKNTIGKGLLVTPNDIYYMVVGSTGKSETERSVVAKKLNEAFAKGLNELVKPGITVGINEMEESKGISLSRFKRACYLTPHPNELVVDGKKLSAYTHKTTGATFYNEGYLPYENYAEQLIYLLKARSNEDKTKYYQSMAEETTFLKEILKPHITFEDIVNVMIKEMVQSFNIQVEQGTYTEEELVLGKRLYEEKYCHDAWTYRR